MPLAPSADGRLPRSVYLASFAVTVAGLVLGATYGGPFEPLSLYVAVLLGGLLYRQGDYLPGRELYGNVLIAVPAGAALASLVLAGVVSVALGVPFVNVVWSTAVDLLLNVVSVGLFATVGYAVAVALDFVGVDARDPVAVAALLVGSLLFVGVQVRLGQFAESEALGFAVLSDEQLASFQLYQVLGLLTGAAGFAGFLALLGDRNRQRVAFAGLLVAGLASGGVGVGQVHGQIQHAQATTALQDEVTVTVTNATVEDDALAVTLRVHNPSGTELRVTGSFLRAASPTDDQLAYGAARPPDGSLPVTVEPGATVTTTVAAGLTPAQAESLHDATVTDRVTVSSRVTLETTDTNALAASAIEKGFVVADDCTFPCEDG